MPVVPPVVHSKAGVVMVVERTQTDGAAFGWAGIGLDAEDKRAIAHQLGTKATQGRPRERPARRSGDK